MARPNASTITWFCNHLHPEKYWAVEHTNGYGGGQRPYRVRCYVHNVLATDVGFATEVQARQEFERRVEANGVI